MRRNGKDVDDGAGFSLGSSGGEEVGGESSEAHWRAFLARSGLSILAGKDLRLESFSHPSSLSLRLGKSDVESGSGEGKLERRPNSPSRRLSVDECWRTILELGMRWPTWDGMTTIQSTPELTKERDDPTVAVAGGDGHLQGGQPDSQQQREQEFVKLLAARALEALAAQSPPWRSAGAGAGAGAGTLTSKRTQRLLHKNIAGEDAVRALRRPTPPILPVYQQPRPPTKALTSSRAMPAPQSTLTRPQTGELTIFYDGIVNVCSNVSADKARLVMMYAEKAGLSAQAGARMQRSRFGPPLQGAPPQLMQALRDGPVESGLRPGLQSSKVPLPAAAAGPSATAPCGLFRSVSHVGSSSSLRADENTDAAKRAAHGKTPVPISVTVTTQNGNPPRQLRQSMMLKPLPNARRNSLARFLDSRKRWTAAPSEEMAAKKAALGDEGGGPSGADEKVQGDEKLGSVHPSSMSNVITEGTGSDAC